LDYLPDEAEDAGGRGRDDKKGGRGRQCSLCGIVHGL